MATPTRKPVARKNGSKPVNEISELGRILRRVREKHEASGGKFMNRRELEREIAERRGLR